MKLHYNSQDLSVVTARKLQAAVLASGAQVQFVPHKTKDNVSKLSPFNLLPILQTPEGPIFSSSTILRYLSTNKKELYGESAHHQALVDQWLDFITTQFEPAARAVVAKKNGIKLQQGKLMEDVNKFLAVVEKHLKGKKFLVGQSLTIADLSLASCTSVVFGIMFGQGQRKKYPNTVAWYNSVAAANKEVGPTELPKQAHDAFKGGKKGKKEQPKKQEKKQQKKQDDDDDLFGDDDDAPAVTVKPTVKVQPTKQKKKAIAKSIVVFDVKVYEQQEDLQALFQKIKAIEMDGLVWNNEPKIVAVCFGMNKLQVGCVVEDQKISLDDIYEKIQDWEEVQSVDTVSFQKL